MDDDFETENEVNAHLRVSVSDLYTNTLKNIKFRDRNSIDQFYTITEAAFEKMKENGVGFLHYSAKEAILENIGKLNKPGYKNSVAFILGFFARDLRVRSMNEVFEVLPIVNRLSSEYLVFRVSKPDIIRYARLWSTILV